MTAPRVKALAQAVGLGLAIASGQAAAGYTISLPSWGVNDFDIDALGTLDGSGAWVPGSSSGSTSAIITKGDILLSTFTISVSGGATVAPSQLSGLTAIQVQTITPSGTPGLGNFVFEPVTQGMDAILSAMGVTPTSDASFAAGGGAMAAFYSTDAPAPALAVAGSEFDAGTNSCSDLATCAQQAAQGSLQFALGIGSDPDDFWKAFNSALDADVARDANYGTTLGSVNAGLDVLVNNIPGLTFLPNGVSCSPYCAPGGRVTYSITGSLLGFSSSDGGTDHLLSASLANDGAVATSNVHGVTTVARVPEPATLALLGIGLFGLGGMRRKSQV
jgi:hypothetical protein